MPADQIGGHANILDTSEMLFVNPKHVRKNKLAPGGGYENSGVSGDPSKVDTRARQGASFRSRSTTRSRRSRPDGGNGQTAACCSAEARGGGGGGRGGRGGGRGGRARGDDAPQRPRPTSDDGAGR